MHPRLRFLFIALIVIIASTLALVIIQVKRASGITTRSSEQPLVSGIYPVQLASVADPILGNPGAPLNIIVFMDIGNSDSRPLYAALTGFVRQHPTAARLVWKDAPTVGLFTDPRRAHEALWCAWQEKQFWPLADLIMMNNGAPDESALTAFAERANLDVNAWKNCLHSPAAAQAIQDAMTQAQNLGLGRTPALFINNRQINLDANIDVGQMLNSLL